MMQKEIVIIGGGVAGLSAAIHAIENGFRPIIIEKNRYLGGRVRSFHATDIDQMVDNGQHLLSAAYTETSKFLKKIGSFHKIYFQKNLNILFIKDSQYRFHFRTFTFPAPLHFFIPLIMNKKFTQTEFNEYVNFIRCNLQLKTDKLKKMTVSHWLNYCSQNENLQNLLWKPLTYSILNTPPEDASAYLLYKSISQSFLHSRKRARLGIPKDWLSEIFVKPAEQFIKSGGGSIYLFNSVRKLITDDNMVLSVVTQKQQIDAPCTICTIPPYSLSNISQNSNINELETHFSNLAKFEYNPIMTINLFLKSPIHIRFPVSIMNSPIQWIFSHPTSKTHPDIYGYALVSSAATDLSKKKNEQVIEIVRSELLRILNIDIFENHLLKNYKIIKEKRATINQTPEALNYRLNAQTPLKNFFLAGDWIDTSYPATIEGAILSGRIAVEEVLKSFK